MFIVVVLFLNEIHSGTFSLTLKALCLGWILGVFRRQTRAVHWRKKTILFSNAKFHRIRITCREFMVSCLKQGCSMCEWITALCGKYNYSYMQYLMSSR